MQRNVLIALVALVVAVGVAATAAIVLDDGEDTVALNSPSPIASAAATAEVVTASPSPEATPTVTSRDGEASVASAAPTATPAPTPTFTTKPGVTIRPASSVDCDEEPAFCSSTDGMTVVADRELEAFDEAGDAKSTTRPTITMQSSAWDGDEEEIDTGEQIASIHVEVNVKNSSKSTYVFAKREIVLEIFRNGKLYDSFATKGPGFEMTPGSEMNGTFDRPIIDPGDYKWRAKVWYYKK
jgi:hypothetical protein